MIYGEQPSQEEIAALFAHEQDKETVLNELKGELSDMRVGAWLVFRGKVSAPPIAVLAIDLKGKYEFYVNGKDCYVKRLA